MDTPHPYTDYPMSLFVINEACPNFWEDRQGRVPSAFVIHKPEGTLPGVIDYLDESITEKSYNYIIALTGQVHCLVDPGNAAWANGGIDAPTWSNLLTGVNPNLYTISIALEGFAANPETPDQLCSLAKLMADLSQHYKIPLSDLTVVYHREIYAGKTCPGFHLNKFSIVMAAQYILNAFAATGGNV